MRTINDEKYRRIIERRDPRYDGRFYWGVKTTRIYCRPVCPARPKPENILIFKSATEAEGEGYRPCLRCRPDLAPGSQRWDGTAISVGRALRLIEEWPDDSLTVERLADAVGMTDRHLRRLFTEHLGASPIEIMVNRRLHLARQLMTETQQPITDIAFASGFQSIRRFNEAFKALYRQAPSAFRKQPEGEQGGLRLQLAVRKPYDWNHMLGFLRRHHTYGLEQVQGDSYIRFLSKPGSQLQVSFTGDALAVDFQNIPLTAIRPLLARVRHLFDVDHNPQDLPRNSALATAGIRLPGCFQPFETAVSIIIGQVVSTAQAQRLMRKLVEGYGHRLADDAIFVFPSPELLMTADLESIGLTRSKAGAIRELSSLVHKGTMDLTRSADLVTTRRGLADIPGVGPWTVELIAMRCLGDADAFPRQDLIIRRVHEYWAEEEVLWASLRSYLTQVLWRDHASKGQSS